MMTANRPRLLVPGLLPRDPARETYRVRPGEATVVDSSLLALGMWATGANILAAGLFGMTQIPGGSRDNVPNPIMNMYRSKDGRFVTLMMLQSDRFWPDLVTTIGHPAASTRSASRWSCVVTPSVASITSRAMSDPSMARRARTIE